MFQGGVAANIGIREALKRALNKDIYVPKHFDVMGAIGAAILAQEEMDVNPRPSKFNGWDIPNMVFESKGFECKDCPNHCEVVEIKQNGKLIARNYAKNKNNFTGYNWYFLVFGVLPDNDGG